MKRINIKDLAKFLSLSPSTISRALSNHADLSKETKERVQQAATLFNYVPNLHARYFRKKNTRMIALILPKFDRFFVPQMMEGIQKVVDDNNYRLIVFQSSNDSVIEEDIIKYCLSWMVDGVLISLSDGTDSLDHLGLLKDNDVPVVLLDKVIKTENHSTVTINDFETARLATKTFFEKGQKNILGLFAHENLNITKDRLSGYKSVFNDYNVAFDRSHYLIVNNPKDAEGLLLERLKEKSFSGFFFMTDELLVNSFNCILSLNKKIPEEISIVSISDGTSPIFLNPKITHIFHSGFDIGYSACQLLLKYIQDKEKTIEHLQLDTNLVDMGSVS